MSNVISMAHEFFRDPRVLAILGLIILDLILGISKSIRLKEFEFRRVADFYLTNVLPYILGFLGFYVAAKIIATPEFLGPAAWLISEGTITMAWGMILLALLGSIVENAKALGYKIIEQAPDPPDSG